MIFLPRRAVLLSALGFEWTLQRVYAGNTICTSTHTDWYTSAIGETPCTTYERLRQICNINYQVGTLTRNTPPDHCDDQVQDCCCNSISFALSMLCLACQDNTSDGFDAGKGAYQLYLLKDSENTCSGRKDKNFTVTIQNAVCNAGIKIEDQLYNLFWGDGQWFYVYTRDSIIRDHAAFSNKTQTKCLTTNPPAPPPSAPAPQPSTSALSSSTFTLSSGTSVLSSSASSALSSSTSALSSSTSAFSSSTSVLSSSTSSFLPSNTSTQSSASTPASGVSGSRSGNDDDVHNSSQLGPGAIAGIVVGALVILGLLAAIFILLCRRRRRAQAVTEHPEVNPYTLNGTGAASSGHYPSNATTAGYLSDGDVTTTSATTLAPIGKHNRERRGQRNPHPSMSNTNTSASDSGFGSTPQGSSMAVDLGHEPPANRHAGLLERHTDAGPVLGANLSRSGSGRLPPAYGEQISPVGSGTHTTEFRPHVHPPYNLPESRYAQVESDYAPPVSSELGARIGTESEGMSMREVGHSSQPSTSPLVPLRRER